jgi:hypothetical protein
LYGLHAV